MESKSLIKRRKKLIEVSIPLEQINEASQLEKQPFTRKHPRSMHIWWARRPHAAVRAVIFCQLVDDPSAIPEEFSSLDAQYKERQRLFNIVCQIVRWENTSKNPYFEWKNSSNYLFEVQESLWEKHQKYLTYLYEKEKELYNKLDELKFKAYTSSDDQDEYDEWMEDFIDEREDFRKDLDIDDLEKDVRKADERYDEKVKNYFKY